MENKEIKTKRKNIPLSIKSKVLHEAGFKCGNPVCRTIITLDIHHLEPISKGGADTPDNLLALCPNCHSLHHMGKIPEESLRTWKIMLLALNEAFDRKSMDILLSLQKLDNTLWFLGGQFLSDCAALISSGFVKVDKLEQQVPSAQIFWYGLHLSEKGKSFIKAWEEGKQKEAINLIKI